MADQRRVHPHLVVHDDGAVRVLRIDREEKLGAFSGSLVAALGREVAALQDAEDVRAVVLTGTGKGFVAGADIGEYATSGRAEFEAYQHRSRLVFDALSALPQPTVAAVNGYAFGGGFEIALCCDVILCSSNARFGLPEVRLGLVPGGGGPPRLAREFGTRWTKELVMTGRTVYPEEARARGVVARVVEPDQLSGAALELATTLAELPAEAVRVAKRRIDLGREQDLEAALTDDQTALGELFETPDAREGIEAFLEKRPPVFARPPLG
ncbi:enoyl-CoA hydratase/isomerase family protein [Isoptericola sp. NPDC057653]|uniref:enoyl-CoA hydratase/isomerase family protein n=1 Tax=Isoptericola sp. NPDC057653 TaxID=3346195 RepID=UPI00367FCC9A